MIITDIQQQKKNEERYSVFIDDKFAFGMTGVDILFYKLKTGDTISREKLDNIIENLLYEKAKEKALKKLDYKLCTKKEIYEKLQPDYSTEIVERVMDMLEKYGYINDENYAMLYTRDCFRLKGWGKIKIKHQLRIKGVADEIIEKALQEIMDVENTKATELLVKKFKGADLEDLKLKQKAYSFLLQRGYTYDDISSALERYKEQNYN